MSTGSGILVVGFLPLASECRRDGLSVAKLELLTSAASASDSIVCAGSDVDPARDAGDGCACAESAGELCVGLERGQEGGCGGMGSCGAGPNGEGCG